MLRKKGFGIGLYHIKQLVDEMKGSVNIDTSYHDGFRLVVRLKKVNTTFKILWFEDEPVWFNMEKLRIEGILKTHYLIPVIERRDGDDFDLEELTGNDYDLIFMDYKLAEGKTGDTIVAAIRNSDILTDILFYSSEEQNMLSAIREQMPPIDGVYLTKRDYTIFTEKAQRIIQKIVKRSEDVVNLRGFVLDNTSAFEVRIREILNICWQKFTQEQKNTLTQTLTKLLEVKKAWVSSQIDTAQQAECTLHMLTMVNTY